LNVYIKKEKKKKKKKKKKKNTALSEQFQNPIKKTVETGTQLHDR
jgi:hypothetical protein